MEEVFAFFQDPENLARITPKSLNFKNINPHPVEMKEGAHLIHQIKVLGIPLKWESLITRFDPPNLFVDEQIKGPYAFWKHVHSFKEEAEGTLIEDEVNYALRMGPFGRLAHALKVKRDLKNIFDYRQKKINEFFG
ncbi:MAG: SRPBCC family protein [bacterium]|nr:SRPBCC family protein [bacterium]